ncbi:hypothetical protein [Xanthobacter agilis]|uniref:Uncharacterized protein n=1 Tax=Xanthobacter agilis TaxID=47492 RepID=A0ABU0L8Y1_XANAG|nr:hypothetical protein [Xanthobacter agilis]MDQ0503569.1 hypothetical protein [Xanthobacter agilis]
MVEITSVTSSVRVVKFLQTPQERAAENIMAIVFLNSKVFRGDVGITNDIVNVFRYNDDLRESLNAFYQATLAADGKGKDGKVQANGASTQSNFHDVLADTIAKHRSLFPSEEFTIRTDLPGGGTQETVIPAAGGLVTSASSSAASLLATLFGTGTTGGSSTSLTRATQAYGA